MTLTQLSAFVLVARLGSVTAAARTLGVSESAVSQALAALRKHFDDPLIVRGGDGMTLTSGGSRLLGIAAQMVALDDEARASVRAARGASEQLRLVATSEMMEFVVTPLVQAFTALMGSMVEVSTAVAASERMPILLTNKLADIVLGPQLTGERAHGLHCEPIFRGHLIAVAAPNAWPVGPANGWQWLVDASGMEAAGETGLLLRLLDVPERNIRVSPSRTAAWEAAAEGAGVAVATAHLVAGKLRRGELRVVDTPHTPLPSIWYAATPQPDRAIAAATSMLRFLTTPRATQLMSAPGAGVPPSKFRPPVHVTIWS